ncbi:MAG: DUF58 domain-containing protein [Acidobacteriota bacterium]
MIVPERRLIGWSALVLLPCGVLIRWFPYACGTVLFGFVVVAVIDAARASRPLSALEVRLPPLVRLTRLRRSEITMEVSNGSDLRLTLRLGLAWPAGLRPLEPEVKLEAEPQSTLSFPWACVPAERGKHRLSDCFVQTLSPLRLWAARAEKPSPCEVRVYPDLAAERRKTASILARGTTGTHLLRQIGQGREFEKLREYVPGDSYSEIHWKATARRGRPITKAFQLEKTQEVYLVLDNSRLSGRIFEPGTWEPRRPAPAEAPANWPAHRSPVVKVGKDTPGRDACALGTGTSPALLDTEATAALEYFISAGLLLGIAAQRYGDLFGLLVYSDRIERFVRAGGGRQHFNACRQALYDLKTSPASPDLQELGSFIGGRLRRRALLVFLTDFDDPVTTESFVRNLELVARRHLVLVNTLKDHTVGTLFGTQPVGSLDDLYASLAGHLEWQRMSELQKTLSRMGIQMELHRPEWLGGRLISQYLNVKQRQLL